MPIRRFLNGEQFDPETVRILGVAFEKTCVALRIGDCADDVRQAIANKIIEIAKTGGRSPDRLCRLGRMRDTLEEYSLIEEQEVHRLWRVLKVGRVGSQRLSTQLTRDHGSFPNARERS